MVIGSFINPLEPIGEDELKNSLQLLQRIYNIAMDGNYTRKFKKSDYVFFHNLSNINVLDTKMLENAFQYGYEKTIEKIETIKQLVN